MNTPSLRSLAYRLARRLLPLFCFLLVLAVPGATQTTQPYLFAATSNGSGNSPGFVTLLRNGTTGVLSLVPNTSVSFKDPCYPTTIDPTGTLLLGACGEGIAMYTLDATTGIVSETAASPYFASVNLGQNGVLVVAESTGQYVYLLKVGSTQPSVPSTFTLDTFQIDPITPSLVAVNSQSLSFNATFVQAAADPARHGMFIFVNQDQGGPSLAGLLFAISFDLSSGTAAIPTSGTPVGDNARSLAISPSGGYLALGWGDTIGSLTVYGISTSNFGLSLVGSVTLGPEAASYGSYSFPDSLFFSPGGNLLYVQAPPADFSGGGLPFLVFDPASLAQLATPISLSSANFLNGLADPQAPFTYVSNPSPTYGLSVYEVDLSTGLPSQPSPISAPFFPQINLSPLFVTVEQSGQGIQGPTLGTSPGALTFGATTTGQSSAPQNIVLKSLGTQAVSLTSIQISGANASDFKETDNCLATPVIPTNHTCTVAVTYAPGTAGSSDAVLYVTDNAAGSPQAIGLSGTAVSPGPSAPAVTLNPASTLNFPGTPTQGTSTAPQNLTLTNSGGAPLQFLSAVLSGFNSSDFNISADTCSGSIAVSANCTISIVFSPQAAGVRTTTLTITDNAANSPQSVTISGTAAAAASITVSAGSSTAATLTAGQTADFKLQATPGGGFSGALSFTCSGAPFGATCSVPSNLSISGGSPVSFTVSVSTLGASQTEPALRVSPRPRTLRISLLALGGLAALVLLLWGTLRRVRIPLWSPVRGATVGVLSVLLVCTGNGCGSATVGSASSGQTTPPPKTAATPSIQPSGGTFSSAQSVTIADITADAAVYYTTDGSTPTSASAVYTAPLSLSSATTIQAVASASGYADSSVSTAAFKFRTPAGTYPITVDVSATPKGSSKSFALNPITLTLVVN